MDRRRRCLAVGQVDECAVPEKRGIQCRKPIVLHFREPVDIRPGGGYVVSNRFAQAANSSALAAGLGVVGEGGRVPAVDEYEPCPLLVPWRVGLNFLLAHRGRIDLEWIGKRCAGEGGDAGELPLLVAAGLGGKSESLEGRSPLFPDLLCPRRPLGGNLGLELPLVRQVPVEFFCYLSRHVR